jgi:alpha-1,3-rhamnosyltransferase
MSEPLVSIIVLTYNSEKYILETLESIKNQTYQNLELIISDDCSRDNTIKKCKDWISLNKFRFKNTKLITSGENTGIPSNCNRGLKVATGEWIKIIAGDDVFFEDAIEKVIKFLEKNPDIKVIDTKVYMYDETMTRFLGELIPKNSKFFGININSEEQLVLFANNIDKRRLISTVGTFIHKSVLNTVGSFDVHYRFLEDSPMWFSILKHGFKFFYAPIVTVKYRRHLNSISTIGKKRLIITQYHFNVMDFMFSKIYPYLKLKNKINIYLKKIICNFIYKNGNSGYFMYFLYKLSLKLRL